MVPSKMDSESEHEQQFLFSVLFRKKWKAFFDGKDSISTTSWNCFLLQIRITSVLLKLNLNHFFLGFESWYYSKIKRCWNGNVKHPFSADKAVTSSALVCATRPFIFKPPVYHNKNNKIANIALWSTLCNHLVSALIFWYSNQPEQNALPCTDCK